MFKTCTCRALDNKAPKAICVSIPKLLWGVQQRWCHLVILQGGGEASATPSHPSPHPLRGSDCECERVSQSVGAPLRHLYSAKLIISRGRRTGHAKNALTACPLRSFSTSYSRKLCFCSSGIRLPRAFDAHGKKSGRCGKSIFTAAGRFSTLSRSARPVCFIC